MKGKNAIYFAVLLLCFAAAVSVALLGGGGDNTVDASAAGSLEDLLRYGGWQQIDENNDLIPVDGPSYRFPGQSLSVRIANTLPRSMASGTVLAFESVNTYVEVRVDGELIYQNLASDKARPYGMWNFVPLASEHAEGRVTIQFTGTDAYDVGIIPEILMGPQPEIMLLAHAENNLNTQLSVSVLLFGALVFLFSLVASTDSGLSYDFILLGLYISSLGLSLLLQIVSPTAAGEFIKQSVGLSLSGLLPAIYCVYRREHAPEVAKGKYTNAFWVGIGFFLTVFILHWIFSGVALPLRAITYLGFECLYGLCLYGTLHWEREDSRVYRVLMSVGLLVLMVSMGLEGFTHLGYTSMRRARPMVLGAFAFALFQAVAALLHSYDHVERQSKMEQEVMRSRIALTMYQLKPHYIRNSLSVIRTIILQDPKKARRLLNDFTQYLTYNIESLDGAELIDFATEIQHIREYTALEQERLRGRLQVEYHIADAEFMVPALAIQPFVENAIRHGIWPRKTGGTVCVSSTKTEDAHIITVEDDGVGFSEAGTPGMIPIPGHGVGIKTATYRIEQMMHGRVDIESSPDWGSKVTITIPKEDKEHEDDLC